MNELVNGAVNDESLHAVVQDVLGLKSGTKLSGVLIRPDGTVVVALSVPGLGVEERDREALRVSGAPGDFLDTSHRAGGACHVWAEGFAAALTTASPVGKLVAPWVFGDITAAVHAHKGDGSKVRVVVEQFTPEFILEVLARLSDEALDRLRASIEDLMDSIRFTVDAWAPRGRSVFIARTPLPDAHHYLDNEDVEDWLTDAVAPYGVDRLQVLPPFFDDDVL